MTITDHWFSYVFKAALNRTIGNETDEIPESKKPRGKKFEVISTSERDEPQAGGLEIGGVTVPKNCLNKRVDSLKFTSNVSRTKTLNNLKKHNIVCLKDFLTGIRRLYIKYSATGENCHL
jgi:hypothetical protein